MANDVVNIGFGREFRNWPRYFALGLLALGSLSDKMSTGALWGDKISLAIAVEMFFVLGYLGISLVLAAILATPGCEMRSIPNILGKITGKPAKEHT